MTTKILAMIGLALLISACESNSNETTPSPSPTAQPTATVAASPSPAPAATLKAGDEVRVTINGSAVAATIVSIEDKAGKATVKVQGETKERTVNLSEIVKQ